jgi:hypothetical protein
VWPARVFFGLCVYSLSFVATENQTAAQTSGVVELHAGYTRLLRFEKPISTVAIGNPDIAAAMVSTDRSLLITGKAAGTTNLLILDGIGGEVLNATLVVTPNRSASAAVSINSSKELHAHHVYRCNPICTLVGRVTPPSSAPLAEPSSSDQTSTGGKAGGVSNPAGQ